MRPADGQLFHQPDHIEGKLQGEGGLSLQVCLQSNIDCEPTLVLGISCSC